MIPYGGVTFPPEGFVAMPLVHSYTVDPRRSEPHYHDFFQVTLFIGQGLLMHDFREDHVSGALLFFLSPGQVHTILPEPGAGGTIISFTREFCDQGTGFLLDLPFFQPGTTVPWIHVPEEALPWVSSVFDELQAEYVNHLPNSAEAFRSWLRLLLVRAARWCPDVPLHDNNRAAVLVRDFHHSVEKNFLRWSSLPNYAKELGVTANHLNDQVRKTTGEAAGEHIRKRRILAAKRQLLHSSMTISEIGYFLGFKDPSYFNRFFKRYEGLTPMEFRTAIREKYHDPME